MLWRWPVVKLSLKACVAFLRRFRAGRVRCYSVPCGCFGRHATVWDCEPYKHIIEKGRWIAEPRAALLLAEYGVAVCPPSSHRDKEVTKGRFA